MSFLLIPETYPFDLSQKEPPVTSLVHFLYLSAEKRVLNVTSMMRWKERKRNEEGGRGSLNPQKMNRIRS